MNIIQCIYCGKITKSRYNDDECNYCEDCEDQANEVANKD
jgi:hypothetical protein